MEILRTWACSILTAALAMIAIEQLLPSGKIRQTAKLAVAVVMMAVMVMPLTDTGDAESFFDKIADSLQTTEGGEYDSVGLYENNVERMLKRALAEVEGFENCNIYVTAEQTDYICTVKRIVIYCTDKNGVNDEAVIAQIADYYKLERDAVTVSR